MGTRPIISVNEWSQVELPPTLNTASVRQRLFNAGVSTLGEAFRLSRGTIFAKGLVGLVVSPDVQVQILPKTTVGEDHERGLRLLSDMLRLEPSVGAQLAVAPSGAGRADLLETVIGGLACALSAELSRGVPRRYFPAVEDLQTIRGKVDLGYQARVPPGAALAVRVRHAPLQIDNDLSRLLRALTARLLEHTRSTRNRALLMNCLDALRGTSACQLSEALADRAEPNQFEDRWEWAVDVARLLLAGQSPDPVRGGASPGFSILFPLHGLFERAIRSRLQRALKGDLLLRPGKGIGQLLLRSSDSKGLLALEPDILIDDNGALAIVGDAKWKRSAAGEAMRDDAYQLVTYLVRAKVKRGFLAYPSSEPLQSVCGVERYDVQGADLLMFVLRIDPERLCSSKPADVAATCEGLRKAIWGMKA